MSSRRHFHVAAGVVVNASGKVLIARRNESLHQGGLWEFPGGKIEPGESVEQALRRELEEELAITLEHSEPLIRIHHAYPDRDVSLDVLRVDAFRGEPRGMLGQPFCWVAPDQLDQFEFPAANRAILAAARLPDRYAILDPAAAGERAALGARLEALARARIELVRVRAKGLAPERYRILAEQVLEFCVPRAIRVVLDVVADWADQAGAVGVHLDSVQLRQCAARPLGRERFVGVSCHDLHDLQQASAIDADFALLSPVLPTASHPQGQPMGWRRFAELTDRADLPVYALGGMHPEHRAVAKRYGAQGIAGIRGIFGS